MGLSCGGVTGELEGRGKGAMMAGFLSECWGQPGWFGSYLAGRVGESGSVFVCWRGWKTGCFVVVVVGIRRALNGVFAYYLPSSERKPRSLGWSRSVRLDWVPHVQPTCGMHLLGLLAWGRLVGTNWGTGRFGSRGCSGIDLFLFILALRGW